MSLVNLRTMAGQGTYDIVVPQTINCFSTDSSSPTHSWIFPIRQVSFSDHLRSPYVPSGSGNYLFSKSIFSRVGGFPEYAGALDAWGFGLRMVGSGSVMMPCAGASYLHRYGHFSYYVRESKKTKQQSLIATSLVLEYSHLIPPGKAKKIFSRKHRYSWFSQLANNPLNIPGQDFGSVLHLERP